MRPLKRLRVEAPRVPTFGDFHPSTKWSIGVRVYHKYHVETFAPGRKRLTLVLLDEQVMFTHVFLATRMLTMVGKFIC